jgi:hypothetical protein
VHLLERWHLGDAVGAPGREEVDDERAIGIRRVLDRAVALQGGQREPLDRASGPQVAREGDIPRRVPNEERPEDPDDRDRAERESALRARRRRSARRR